MNVLMKALDSRKFWVLLLWGLIALVDQMFAQDMVPVVMAYMVGQGVADLGGVVKKK